MINMSSFKLNCPNVYIYMNIYFLSLPFFPNRSGTKQLYFKAESVFKKSAYFINLSIISTFCSEIRF